MTPQEIDRIECAIRHIQTAADVDPWACDIAVEAMRKQIPQKPITICPICHKEIVVGDMHCMRCNQASCDNWSEWERRDE